MRCQSPKLWQLFTFIKAIKNHTRLLPPPADPCVPFEVCREFPDYEKDIYKIANLSPQGQPHKWQETPQSASREPQDHPIQWL